MHPAGQMALREPDRAELLRTEQGRLLRRHQGSELVDVPSQPQDEVLHIGGGLGHRGVLAQHERHRLRRGHRLVTPGTRITESPALTTALAERPARGQRETHDTTPM